MTMEVVRFAASIVKRAIAAALERSRAFMNRAFN